MISMDRLPPVPDIGKAFEKALPKSTHDQNEGSFADTLKGFLSEVNELQHTAGEKTLKFATGEIKDLHEVMVASEEASISMMLLLEIRNKALEAYRELMRISV